MNVDTIANHQPVQVMLAGNPNSGKTSIFNALTGSHQRVGNYPGVTVEKRQGWFQEAGRTYRVTDLPGTYSLTSYSPEERIAQDALFHSGGVVVVVVDSTNLRRSLMLLSQIMLIGANPVLCLNMSDEAKRAGQRLDLDQLRQLLGFPVVETVGHKGGGMELLMNAIEEAARNPAQRNRIRLGERLDSAVDRIARRLPCPEGSGQSCKWSAVKLLQGDPVYLERFRNSKTSEETVIGLAEQERKRIEAETGMDINLFVTESYYSFVHGLLEKVIRKRLRENAREMSDAIDKILVNRIFGGPIFLTVIYAVFWLTFTVGDLPMGWIENGFAFLGNWIGAWWPETIQPHIRSLLLDGIVGGVGGVVVFLPNIVLLFLGLSILEDTGYMARAAFLADSVMHRFGLQGRSFIPLITGLGCSIPGIMATRTLENERDRLSTMLVLPLMSCGARLPIWMLLIPAFFEPNLRAPMLWLIYVVGIGLALGLSLLLRRTLLRGEEAPFVMELPPYRLPTMKGIVRKITERSGLYLRKAGTVILGISIIMWFITAYPKPDSFNVYRSDPAGNADIVTPGDIENQRGSEALRHSIAGRIGSAMEIVLKPLGFDWKLGTAMIGAFAAKEVFVAQLGIVCSLGETDEESANLRETLRREYSPLVGISLMLFLLIATPCMATLAITRRESGSWKWALLQFGGLTMFAYIISLTVYQVGRMIM